MNDTLNDIKVAILVANGFEQSEMTEPKKALEEAGAEVSIISPEDKIVKGWKHTEWGNEFNIDVPLKQAKAEDYDALLLPGGVMNPDKLRTLPEAIQFVNQMYEAGKPIAAICHGPWILINAAAIASRKLTSWPSIKLDLVNAGANWIDEEVVRDGKLVTSRKPDDIPAFNKAMIELFGQ